MLLVQRLEPNLTWVKITGDGQDTARTGLVKAIDVVNNKFSVLFTGDQKVTPFCRPEDFEIIPRPEAS